MTEIDMVLGIVEQAIKIEKFGYEFYDSMRSFVKDSKGQRFISYLAKLEVDHIKWLEEEYERQLAKLQELHENREVDISLLAKQEIFLGDPKLPEVFKDFDPKSALNYGIEIEKRSVAFYEKNMDLGDDDNLRELFRKLADFEKDHITILKNNLKSLETKGSWELPQK
ncbi:MAG: ferritin family protein [Methanomassiliicoccales archaeon]|nr:MAG: ferritin family protein [Methanomassiliicoccales archaeon]